MSENKIPRTVTSRSPQGVPVGEAVYESSTGKLLIMTRDGFIESDVLDKAALVEDNASLSAEVDRLRVEVAKFAVMSVNLKKEGDRIKDCLSDYVHGVTLTDDAAEALGAWEESGRFHSFDSLRAAADKASLSALLSSVVTMADKLCDAAKEGLEPEEFPSEVGEWYDHKRNNKL
jgi:hypothetical protein